MMELAYVNGVFGPIDEAKVSVEDRGFQFGDGVYEVVAARAGRPSMLAAHMARLRHSMEAIGLDVNYDTGPLEPILLEGLTRSGLQEALIYIQITRGTAPRCHLIEAPLTPTVVMTFKPFPELPDELRSRGARLMTTPDIRWARCRVKAITLLPNVLARNEAHRKGFDDALFMTEDGEVREATAANLFIVHQGAITTPPRNDTVLHGITQEILFHCAETDGIDMKEGIITLDDLLAADEAFLSSTTVEVLGLTRVDEHRIGPGTVGPVTRAMFDAFRRRDWPDVQPAITSRAM